MTDNELTLYHAVCQAVGKDRLTDEDIHRIKLFLQEQLAGGRDIPHMLKKDLGAGVQHKA